ncbi:phage tail tape measure protein [Streptomyces bobili]|uniref:phage tail tape measure protein n=1 Tax=Streptomyces bobili TaxID=67280 RepID=UPI00225AD6BF|nr:phage tail tape measure protein [Streptomyces bobili]MCX5522582.1 phage tail tape measure protein [Streptomyces bobili]
MPNVGYATIQIIPSVRGISDELRRQLVGPAGDAGGDAGQAAGGSLKEKLAIGAAVAGAAAGALLVAGIGEAIDQANVTSTLQAQLGTTSKVAADQGKLAGKLYSSGVAGSFQEAADAIKSVVQAGLAPPDATTRQLEAIATKASDVANVFGQDLGGVTNAVSQMLRTGLAKNADEAFDLITKGFQSGADKAGDLLDTVNEYGTQFRKAGLDGADAIGLLNQAIRGGARDADVAADAIKEFSIRAVDGSKSSADGFKALGLNADDMAAKFAKGGKSANGVLDITLDKLRGIKDPVKQSQVAVQLFGTQAEDLGAALLAMDPSSAAKGLGQVGGAADQVGKTIRSGPGHEIEVFTRTLKQGFVDVIGGQVLPIVGDVAHALSVGLGPAVSGVVSVVSGIVNWTREWGIWLAPLAIAIAGVTLALNAQAIATGIVTAVFSVYRAAIIVGTAVTSGFATAQAILNAVMALNPFVLIAIAVIALGAALVIAWKKSETFKAIVMGAWQGIQTAAMWAWDNVLKPLIDGLVVGWKAVATGALWLWNTVLKPVFGFISTAARIVATIYGVVFLVAFKVWWTGVKLYAGFVMTALRAVGDAAVWLWEKAISPVLGWIVGAFKLWWSGVKLYFSLVSRGFQTVGGWVRWLYDKAVAPVFGWIVSAAKLWWTGVKLYFGFLTTGLKAVGGWFKWLWTNGVKPALNGIRNTISTVYNSGIKPVFNTLKSAVGQVGKAFESAKNAIKLAWDKVKGIAKAPVKFIVDTVYNKGIVGVWNKVAGTFGAPKLSTFKFATGGILPGYTPGRDVHMAALSGGEAVMRPEWTRAMGPGYVNTMNAAARTGGVSAIRRMVAGGMPAFADGGIFGWVKSAASKGVDLAKSGVSWLKDGIKASAVAGLNKVVQPLIARISGSASAYRDMISGIPKRMIKAIVDFSGTADKKFTAAGIGGGGYQRALTWARAQNGKPYIWGGAGPTGFDCSGFMGAIENVIRGQAPNVRRWATGAFGASGPAGWVRNARSPFMIGITNAGVGHTAGTLNGVNVESRGGDGVVVGKSARGYNSSLFTSQWGFRPSKYDSGGWLRPGVTTAVNATGRPEAVLTASQWRVMSAAASGHGAGLQVGDRLRLVVDGHEFSAYVDDRADGRVQEGQRQLISVINAS